MIWLIIAFSFVKLAQIYIFVCVCLCMSVFNTLYFWCEFYSAWTPVQQSQGYFYLSHYWILVLWFILLICLDEGNYCIRHGGFFEPVGFRKSEEALVSLG